MCKRACIGTDIAEALFHNVDYILGNLRGKDFKIIGCDGENKSPDQQPFVFDEIFIKSSQRTHGAKVKQHALIIMSGRIRIHE